MVRKETERMAKENTKNEALLKNLDKPSNSSSVEPTSSETSKQDKIKRTVLKIKDYDIEKDQIRQPKATTPDPGAGAPI